MAGNLLFELESKENNPTYVLLKEHKLHLHMSCHCQANRLHVPSRGRRSQV